MSSPIVVIVHNVRSLWNIGSFFRTCDAFGISHVHLCGYTAAPPRTEISKTALGAETWVPWSKDADAIAVIAKRRSEGYLIAALERAPQSVSIETYAQEKPLCLIVGHEILGVSEDLRACSDVVLSIPMIGRKHSLNVSVALGIALYQLRCKTR